MEQIDWTCWGIKSQDETELIYKQNILRTSSRWEIGNRPLSINGAEDLTTKLIDDAKHTFVVLLLMKKLQEQEATLKEIPEKKNMAHPFLLATGTKYFNLYICSEQLLRSEMLHLRRYHELLS